MSDASELLTIAAAAKAAGVPERSLFRAAEKGKVATTKRDGVSLVALADVQTWAERRAAARLVTAGAPPPATATAGSLPAAHASLAAGGSRFGGVGSPPADGALAAEVFDAFEAGKSPTEVVRELELPPKLVRDLWKEHEDLQNAGKPGRPPISEQIAALEQRIEVLTAEVHTATEWGTLSATVAQLRSDLDLMTRVLREMPVPVRTLFDCGCGARGLVATHVRCTSCGRDSTFGFHAPSQ